MKHNKKILMGIVGGMALAAVATGGVASFAWFTTSYTAQVGSVNHTQLENITAVDPQYGSTVYQFPLNAQITPVDSKSLELAHYYAADALQTELGMDKSTAIGTHAAGLFTALVEGNSTFYSADPLKSGNTTTLHKVYKLALTVPSSATFNADGTYNSAGTGVVTLTGAEIRAHLAEGESVDCVWQRRTVTVASRAKFTTAAAAAESVTVADGKDGSTASETTFNVPLAGFATAEEVDYYFGIYVEGVRASGVDASAVNASFDVTVSRYTTA